MTADEKSFFGQRPWIWLVALFSLLILGWSMFFKIAYENPPQEVELGESLPMPEVSADSTAQTPQAMTTPRGD